MNHKFKSLAITLPALIVTAFAGLILQATPAFASTGQFFNGTTATSNTSSNWAGYVETGGPYTAINGSWTVPSVVAPAGTADSANAEWIGIGGVGTTDLIQTGTQAIIQNGVTTYQAWYELLPSASTPVPVSVKAGDSMSASLTETSPNEWMVSIRDNTNGQSYSTTVSYASSLSSAEWIEEMPSISVGQMIPLDDFSTVSFQNAFAMKNGTEGNLAANGAQTMTMIDTSRNILAAPSAIGPDVASFSVTRNTSVNAATSPNVNVQQFRVGSGQGMRRGGGGAQGFQRIPGQQLQVSTQGQTRTITFRNSPYVRFQIQFGMRI